jgi:peptide/nickel transport system ATP-binding protein
LNPVMTVGAQLCEALAVHNPTWTAAAIRKRGIELLGEVGVPQADLRYAQYPHQFSGGMAQRVMIAIAIANRPKVLIADEPTTAVDVTIQAQLLDLLREAQIRTGAATVLITHDLGVVAEVADHVAVMYAGRVVERGAVGEVFARPAHPYTVALLASLPRLDAEAEFLETIPGSPPDMRALPPGCTFEPRCPFSAGRDPCRRERPALLPAQAGSARVSACHFRQEVAADPPRMGSAA